MKCKLQTKMIIAISGFLLVMLGSSLVLYRLFAEEYYGYVTKIAVEETYQEIEDMKICQPISREVKLRLEELAEDGINVLICNEKDKVIFSSRAVKVTPLIRRHVKKRKTWYSRNPEAVVRKKRVNLYGIVETDSVYYVYLWQNMTGIKNTVSQTGNLFAVFITITLIAGTLFIAGWMGRMVYLIREISDWTKRIAEGNFSKPVFRRAIPRDELGDLVDDVGAMSDIIARDIRALENYNFLLKERMDRLEKYQEVHQDYITKTTHDLKTPLAIIASQVEMMELSQDAEKRRYYLESIQDEIDRMSERISDVLKNSAFERSLRDIVLEKVELNQYMIDLAGKYEAWMKTENIDFQYTGEANCYAMVARDALEEAIHNYMLNACAHTARGEKIRICLTCDSQSCVISVMNEGQQIEESDLKDIWEKYYQKMEPQDGRRTAYGVGLGLQIVKEIVVMHDGAYGVENVEGGVCFYIRLPRIDA